MNNKKYLISRRTLLEQSLKGACSVSIGLPMLEIMFANDKAYGQALNDLKFIHLYLQDGPLAGTKDNRTSTWKMPKGKLPDTSAGMTTILQMLNPKDIAFLGGLNNPTLGWRELTTGGNYQTGANEHTSGPIHALTGAPPTVMGNSNAGRESINNTIGRKLVSQGKAEKNTLQASLFRGGGYNQRDQSGAYATYSSWRADGKHDDRYTSPEAMFNYLSLTSQSCKDSTTYKIQLGDKSALDFVLERINKLKSKASSKDKVVLEQYFDSFRETEKSVSAGDPVVSTMCSDIGINKGDPRDQTNPTDFAKYQKDFAKVVALGLKSNKVGTMALQHACETSSGMYSDSIPDNIYKDIKVPAINFHTEVAHHIGNSGYRDLYTCYNRFQTSLAQDIINELKAQDVFSNTIFLFGWSLGGANSHQHSNIPTFISGGANTGVKLQQNHDSAVDHKKVLRAICKKFGIEGSALPNGLTNSKVKQGGEDLSDDAVFNMIFNS